MIATVVLFNHSGLSVSFGASTLLVGLHIARKNCLRNRPNLAFTGHALHFRLLLSCPAISVVPTRWRCHVTQRYTIARTSMARYASRAHEDRNVYVAALRSRSHFLALR